MEEWLRERNERERKERRTVIIWVVVVVLIVLAGSGAFGYGCITGCGPSYSNGQRSGYVIKLSRKGVIYKSWEGEMALAGPSGFAPVTWEFSVRDEAVVKQLQEMVANGKRVTLTYNEWMWHPAKIGTDYEVTAVQTDEVESNGRK